MSKLLMQDADKKLLELAEKATPRPWRIRPCIIDDERQLGIVAGDDLIGTVCKANMIWLKEGEAENNADYIVAAIMVVPRLIHEKEALLRRIESLRRALTIYSDNRIYQKFEGTDLTVDYVPAAEALVADDEQATRSF